MTQVFSTTGTAITAVDTNHVNSCVRTQLTDGGSSGSTVPMLVPGGKNINYNSIITILDGFSNLLVAATSDYAAAGSASIILRIEGPALLEGPEVITIAAVGGTIFK